MLNFETPIQGLSDIARLGPAVLAGDEQPDGSVTVRLPGDVLYAARVAVPRPRRLARDQEVLVAGDPDDGLFVVGLLAPLGREGSAEDVLATGSGAYATRVVSPDQPGPERLRVFSPHHELLFEYEPATGRTVVNVARGNLVLRTEEGDIDLESAGRVRIGGRGIRIAGDQLDIEASHTRWITARLETVVETLVEKARNVYRTVEQLTQLRTGRMRTLVDETYQLRSRNAYVKAEKDYKIKGDQIHLG